MRRLKVVMDVDGVLADFTSRVISLVNSECGKRFTSRDVRTWEIFDSLDVGPGVRNLVYDIMRGPGGCKHLSPYPGAREGMAKLREVADVIVATCPLSGSMWWTFEREEWLETHFGIPKALVHHVHDKSHIHGDVLVDDNPRHLATWLTYWRQHPVGLGSVEAVVPFTVHWTANGTSLPPDLGASYRVGDWDELVRVLS